MSSTVQKSRATAYLLNILTGKQDIGAATRKHKLKYSTLGKKQNAYNSNKLESQYLVWPLSFFNTA